MNKTSYSQTPQDSLDLGPYPRGGGTLIFTSYVGSGPASTIHLQKISGISSTPKKYLKFYNPQKNPPFCTLTLRKYIEMHRNDP